MALLKCGLGPVTPKIHVKLHFTSGVTYILQAKQHSESHHRQPSGNSQMTWGPSAVIHMRVDVQHFSGRSASNHSPFEGYLGGHVAGVSSCSLNSEMPWGAGAILGVWEVVVSVAEDQAGACLLAYGPHHPIFTRPGVRVNGLAMRPPRSPALMGGTGERGKPPLGPPDLRDGPRSFFRTSILVGELSQPKKG